MNCHGRKRIGFFLAAILTLSVFGNYRKFLTVSNPHEINTDWTNEAVSPSISQAGVQDYSAVISKYQQGFYQHHHEKLQALISESTILNWKPRGPTGMGFRPFFDYFQEDSSSGRRRKYVTGDICRSAKMLKHDSYVPRPHVLFLTPFDENWGALSTHIPNRTKDYWNLTKEWKRNKCDRKLIFKYLNHKATRAVVAVQFQDLDHPKLHSLPLGLNTHQVRLILDLIHQQPAPSVDSRSQLIMINSRPRIMRSQVLETVLRNFNGTVRNSYGGTLGQYYEEMQRSKFIFSPGGFGLDCYRHWEALYLGTIPVLEHLNRTDGWHRTLRDLPVAWIDNYDNLTPEWLDEEYERILQKTDSFRYEKLTQQYWIDMIRSFAPLDTPQRTRS